MTRLRLTGPLMRKTAFSGRSKFSSSVRTMRLRAVVGDLQAHRAQVAAADEFVAQGEREVLDFLLVDDQLGVARDAELVRALDLHAGEQLVDEGRQHRGQEHEVVSAPPETSGGSWMMRGSERGARTIARWPSRPNASLPLSTTTIIQRSC